MAPPIRLKLALPTVARATESAAQGAAEFKPLEMIDPVTVRAAPDHLGKPVAVKGKTAPTVVNDSKAVAQQQAQNNLFGVEPLAPVKLQLPPQLDTTPPGSLHPSTKAYLPEVDWPQTPVEAIETLKREGYQVTGKEKDSTLLAKDGHQIAITPMELAGTPGYVADADGARHIRLGKLEFTPKQWKAFSGGYEGPLKAYNRILERPFLLGKSPAARDGSELHGPQDGLKHYVSLGRSIEKLGIKRQKRLEILSAEEQVGDALAKAAKEGRLPEHVVIVVEGLDGASKTGNGLTVSRLLADAGYDVKFKAFRRPSDEEAALGPLGRYEAFANPDLVTRPTAWMLDRGYPGDFVHNPKGDLKNIAKAANRFEKRLKDQDVLVVKYIFQPTEAASMRTFGKRYARAKIAEDLLQRRNDLSPDEVLSLQDAASLKPGINDFSSVPIAKAVQRRYEVFAQENDKHHDWQMIETGNRHKGRVEALEVFANEVKKFGKKKEK